MSLSTKILPFGADKKSTRVPGAAPGTVEYTGEQRVENVAISVYDYGPDHATNIRVESITECKEYLDSASNTWVHIQGLHDVEKLKAICNYFALHPLIQEDLVNPGQRTKVEEYENCMFIVMRMLRYSLERQEIGSEQISIILGKDYVLSFQESDAPLFDPVTQRLNASGTRIRSTAADYLAYALIDNITDHYFNLLDSLAEQIEEVEDEVMDEPDEATFHRIHGLRKDVVFARRSIAPAREMLNAVIRDDSEFIHESTKIFIRDVYDHTIQIIDNIENCREMIIGMHDMYMSYVSNKMNEVMKVLTIIATIFIPLTFIAGIYGMNFNPDKSPWNMPELGWYWGYPAVWAIMIIVGILMIIYFKRKGWL